MTINNINTTISGNLCIAGIDGFVTNIHFSCDEHIYELINAYTMYNKFNKAGFEVQLKYIIKNIEKNYSWYFFKNHLLLHYDRNLSHY